MNHRSLLTSQFNLIGKLQKGTYYQTKDLHSSDFVRETTETSTCDDLGSLSMVHKYRNQIPVYSIQIYNYRNFQSRFLSANFISPQPRCSKRVLALAASYKIQTQKTGRKHVSIRRSTPPRLLLPILLEFQGGAEYSEARLAIGPVAQKFVTQSVATFATTDFQSSSRFRSLRNAVGVHGLSERWPRRVMFKLGGTLEQLVVTFWADVNAWEGNRKWTTSSGAHERKRPHDDPQIQHYRYRLRSDLCRLLPSSSRRTTS